MKPILFSTPMVQAILAGRKTQTRRVVKGTALEWLNVGFCPPFVADPGNHMICPYGKVGDVLWVRETWALLQYGDIKPFYGYKADGGHHKDRKWNPSIHMPRTACRLFLEITAIRVERLKDITEEDAKAEGVTIEFIENYTTAFRGLWNIINEGSWELNPWVWVVGFKRITNPQP